MTDEPDLLLGGRFAPVTVTSTFVEKPAEDAVALFLSTRGARVLETTGHPLAVRRVEGSLDQLLSSLEPLVSAQPTRYLFLPTTGPWTAYFDNNWRGTDADGILVSYGSRGTRALALKSSPDSYDAASNRGFHGVQRFQLVWPDSAAPAGFAGRTVGVQVNDSGRWEQMDSGDPQPFETVHAYRARRKRDRVTQPMLADYAAGLGVRPFDTDFYAPDGWALLVSHTDPPVAGSRQFSLAEVRSGGRFEDMGEPARC